MPDKRFPLRDPRTVARDIPGILEAIFPQLSSGLVAHLNKGAVKFAGLRPIPERVLESSNIGRALLFELAVAKAEKVLKNDNTTDWDECLSVALSRQRRHFDAAKPKELTASDLFAADWASKNLIEMIQRLGSDNPDHALSVSPPILGYHWISPSSADFSFGPLLVEVKYTESQFSPADFRQVLMYWILSYLASLERDSIEYSDCILINPRRNAAVAVKFSKLLRLASSGLGKIEVIQLFESIVSGHAQKI